MAGGMLTKQDVFLSNKYLNDINDSTSGGVTVSLPSGAPTPTVSQTIPGDRIVLDDVTALALSDTSTGTLYGGVYMYVGSLSTATNAIARGQIAFWDPTTLPGSGAQGYTVTSDAKPTAAVPTFIAGIFIGAPTKGNYCWIQVAGMASVLFNQTLTGANIGLTVSAYITANASTPASSDCGYATASTTQLATLIGVSVSSPIASTISSVIMTRGNFCGRI